MKITFKKNGADIIENNWESLWNSNLTKEVKNGVKSKR